MNSDVGLPTFGRAGFVLDDPILVTSALLRTNIDNSDSAAGQGLKVGHIIEVRALFDIVAPQKKGDQYGIRLTDQTSTQAGDDIVMLRVVKSSVTGNDLISFAKANFETGALVVESPQDAELEVRKADVKLGKKGDSFTITGRIITDPAASDGLNLPEDVIVVFNGFSQTIPATSFFRDEENEGFQFDGTDSGIKHLKIRDDGSFRVMGQKVDLDGTNFADPVPFSLRIGNDLGQTEITVDVR